MTAKKLISYYFFNFRQELTMPNTIGNAAGEIWKFLNKKGPTSITKIANETGVSKNDVQRAIGWLAREEKITIEQKGRTETISLS